MANNLTKARQQIRQGSFRGVPFNFLDGGAAFGRRGQLTEYPDGEVPSWEDLGRKARQYNLDVLALGDDWFAQRDKLIAAVEQKGPGTLIHPTYGSMKVACTDCREQMSVTALGRIDFTLTFVEDSGKAPSASATSDTGAGVDTANAAVTTASQASFSNAFSVTGASRGVMGRSSDLLFGATDAVRGSMSFLKGDVGGAGSWWSTVASGYKLVRDNINDIQGAVRLATSTVNSAIYNVQAAVNFVGNITSLHAAGGIVASIEGIGTHLGNLMSSVSGLFSTSNGGSFTDWATQRRLGPSDPTRPNVPSYDGPTILNAFKLHLQLATLLARPSLPATTSVQGRQVQVNGFAIYDLMRQAALVQAAGALSAYPFSSRTEALGLRDQLANAFDGEAGTVASSDLVTALEAARVAVVQDVAARSAGLPIITTIQLNDDVPALVLATKLYDDPTAWLDIVARNDLPNPLFTPGGVALEVLTNG
ncbi:MAG TPA: DNA circularization N-terminal domain-containing protein [Aliidongia sp.]|uniref:DNA circularization protein n=1 Tax=Aliidongia sp. TaxID=1914230 RepID=UPI002DDCE0EA|nr:DNA circularization N-terminal domain-containing protein [Aliidongia sp.]HEV2675282.1 DNA circularization N-terminal domain-containing protein [Aliidongia sp.]